MTLELQRAKRNDVLPIFENRFQVHGNRFVVLEVEHAVEDLRDCFTMTYWQCTVPEGLAMLLISSFYDSRGHTDIAVLVMSQSHQSSIEELTPRHYGTRANRSV